MVLGTRGSDLARAQSQMVEDALRAAWPELKICVEVITTRGDETAQPDANAVDRKAGRKGLFTSEIERALVAQEIDVAVHSAKDLPSEQAASLRIAAVLRRAPAEDVFVSRSAPNWDSLGKGATIATGSVRRQYQLRAKRADLRVVDLRGNVPTRLRKLASNDWDGIILARAGLERLGFGLSTGEFAFEQQRFACEGLPQADFLPAGGQGVIALQARSDDEEALHFLRDVNDSETLLCLHAEREFLRLLDGDCDSPVGVLATIRVGMLHVAAQVFEPPNLVPLFGEVNGAATMENAAILAAKLMEKIHAR